MSIAWPNCSVSRCRSSPSALTASRQWSADCRFWIGDFRLEGEPGGGREMEAPRVEIENPQSKIDNPERLPDHIAIIMDGNGRWARQRGLPRIEGHRRGTQSVRATVEECCRLGIGQLTLFCLSSENWKRPRQELDFLMTLLRKYLIRERAEIMEQNIRFTTIGRREGLPPKVLREMDENIRVSQNNTGMVLCLA